MTASATPQIDWRKLVNQSGESSFVNFRRATISASSVVRENWWTNEAPLISAHQDIMEAICILFERVAPRKFEQQSKAVEECIGLSAQLTKGLRFTETAIAEGFYHQGAALIKQEMEIIAAYGECLASKRREGKTPNVGNFFRQFGKAYKDMNDIAHMANSFITKHFVQTETAGMTSPSPVPFYIPIVSKYLFGLHTYFAYENYRMHLETTDIVLGAQQTEAEAVKIDHALKNLIAERVISEDV